MCCIDELDKLACSYHALLEAMEQQQISIAKSGVVTSLSARCALLPFPFPRAISAFDIDNAIPCVMAPLFPRLRVLD